MQRDLGLILGWARFDSYLWFGLSFDSNNFFMQQGPEPDTIVHNTHVWGAKNITLKYTLMGVCCPSMDHLL